MAALIRPAVITDAEGIAQVHVNTWRAAYAGIISAEYLSQLSYERCAQRWRDTLSQPKDNGWVMVSVTEEDKVVGFAHGASAHQQPEGQQFEGEVTVLYVDPDYQRRGLGRRLMAAMADRLQAAGMSSLVVWVLEANPAARSFYESLGGRLVGKKELTIGGDAHTVVAYGWRDISVMCS